MLRFSRLFNSRLFAAAALSVPCAAFLDGLEVKTPETQKSSLVFYSSDEIEELARTPPAPVLDPSQFKPLRLIRRESVSHDSSILTFALPRENDELGLTVASIVVVQGPNLDNGKW